MVACEAFLKVVNRGCLVVGFAELTGRVGLAWLGMLDLPWTESATCGDFSAVARCDYLGVDIWSCWLGCSLVASWYVDDIELAARGLLGHRFLGRIVGDVVAVDDVVVPVA